MGQRSPFKRVVGSKQTRARDNHILPSRAHQRPQTLKPATVEFVIPLTFATLRDDGRVLPEYKEEGFDGDRHSLNRYATAYP